MLNDKNQRMDDEWRLTDVWMRKLELKMLAAFTYGQYLSNIITKSTTVILEIVNGNFF